MLFGVPGLKRILASIFVLVAANVAIISCGSYSPSSSATHKPSGLPFRVFISNPLFPSGTGGAGPFVPVLNIVDALQDQLSIASGSLSPFVVSLSGDSTQPGLMALSSNLKSTLVYSQTGNSVAVVDNETESIATSTGGTSSVPPRMAIVTMVNDVVGLKAWSGSK